LALMYFMLVIGMRALPYIYGQVCENFGGTTPVSPVPFGAGGAQLRCKGGRGASATVGLANVVADDQGGRGVDLNARWRCGHRLGRQCRGGVATLHIHARLRLWLSYEKTTVSCLQK